MFSPDNPLAPHAPTFQEAWHAQVLAMAEAMVKAGHMSTADWAETLGATLRRAEADGKPDTQDTYYTAALTALEQLMASRTDISIDDQTRRKAAWEAAYRATPHGQPVTLGD